MLYPLQAVSSCCSGAAPHWRAFWDSCAGSLTSVRWRRTRLRHFRERLWRLAASGRVPFNPAGYRFQAPPATGVRPRLPQTGRLQRTAGLRRDRPLKQDRSRGPTAWEVARQVRSPTARRCLVTVHSDTHCAGCWYVTRATADSRALRSFPSQGQNSATGTCRRADMQLI